MQPSSSDLESRIYQSLNAFTERISNRNMAQNPLVVKRKVNSFLLYESFLKNSVKILDWGCGDSVVSLMIRETYKNQTIKISGCDIFDAEERSHSPLFHSVGLSYSALIHPYQLPYADASFDTVIANGVLEHAANDMESLKELYRVLEDDGVFIITFLPNQRSYTECINEFLYRFWSKKHVFHRRRYRLKEIKSMLLHSGFEPLSSGYHQVIPSLTSIQRLNPALFRLFSPIVQFLMKADQWLQKVWPINQLASNIYVIAQKQKYIL